VAQLLRSNRTRQQQRIYSVNCLREDADGRCVQPGFGESSRALAWIFERRGGRGEAIPTPMGYVPAPGALDVTGLGLTDEGRSALLDVDLTEWRSNLGGIGVHYATFASRLPAVFGDYLRQVTKRLGATR
jgi:phosphoenolpyruvate carboxykinase (GTP)